MTQVRILIVEDDPLIAMDLESTVVDTLGDDTQMIVVGSVVAALSAADQPLSCALLDVDVVGGRTFGVAQQLQARGTPLAFVSGSPPAEVPEALRDIKFMRKPFSTREIARFVDEAVAGA